MRKIWATKYTIFGVKILFTIETVTGIPFKTTEKYIFIKFIVIYKIYTYMHFVCCRSTVSVPVQRCEGLGKRRKPQVELPSRWILWAGVGNLL